MDKDHLEILLEDIQGKFDLVLEGHDVLHKEIQDTREELCEKINSVDFKVETLNQKIDDLTANLEQLNEQSSENYSEIESELKSGYNLLEAAARAADELKSRIEEKNRLKSEIDSKKQQIL